MVPAESLPAALHALQSLLVVARALAYERNDTELIDILDVAELLPSLIGRREDLGGDFRLALTELAERHPRTFVALEQLDSPPPAGWKLG